MKSPPFAGTVFIDPDIIRDTDPTAFASLTYKGVGPRQMFDRRTNSFNTIDAHLFDAKFGETKIVEIQVNPEFAQTAAEMEATTYARAIGRLPGFLFGDLETVWIHAGTYPFGGGNNNLLIHIGQGADYTQMGVLEEAFVHEATHTSMDSHHAATARWLEAQRADQSFISTYARDNPTREDLAETLLPYLAARFRSERLDPATVDTILATIPARAVYLDCLGLSMATLL